MTRSTVASSKHPVRRLRPFSPNAGLTVTAKWSPASVTGDFSPTTVAWHTAHRLCAAVSSAPS